MPLRMTLTRPGERTPVYKPERIAPGGHSGFYDYTNGPSEAVFVIVACPWMDGGGLVYDVPTTDLPPDDRGEDFMIISADTLSTDTFTESIDRRGTYTREVVTQVGMALQAGRVVIEHYIEN